MRLASRNVTYAVGAAVILSLVLALYLSLTASTGLPGQSFRTARADFSDIGSLREGDEVRRASVRVGQVQTIAYEDGKARVVFQLDADSVVYRDAKASVVARSALGQNFVMLDPGSPAAGVLPDGGALESRGTSQVNLDRVLSALDEPTRKGLATLVREAGTGAAGHSDDLAHLLRSAPDLLADLEQVSTSLAAPETGLDDMLRSSATLAGRFQGREQQVGALLRNLRGTLEAVGVDDSEPLEQSLDAAPGTLDSARESMTALRQPLVDLRASMVKLRPGAEALGVATPDLRAALRDAVGPLKKVERVAQDAEPAVESLTELVGDARPLSDRLRKTFAATAPFVGVLAPYAPDISRFFTYWTSANGYRDKSGHYLRLDLVIRPESFDGSIPIRDPFVHRNPYPAPGKAELDRPGSLGGN